MILLNLSNILLSLFIFILNLIELNASQEVTLTCGSNQNTQRGVPGYPGKRGPKGEVGAPGLQGSRGLKGDLGQCPDICATALNRISLLEEYLHVLNECLHRCINGRCINENNTYVCSCSFGYTGTNCTDNFCNDPPCPANSRCTGPNQCTCNEGYQLANGTCKAVCFGEYSCGDRGFCVSPGECRCNTGYTGSFTGCQTTACLGRYSCGDRGVCISPDECRCNSGYTGSNTGCQTFVCNDPPCGSHSHCSGPNRCRCDEGYQLNNGQCTEIIFSNCNDVSRTGFTRSGIYNITVPGRSNKDQVYCDLNTDGGGWLVFQRRLDGSVDFYRNWTGYQQGFGDLNGEFWLGLDFLHAISESNSFQLRVDLEDWDGNTAYAVYRHFSVGNSQSKYRLNVNQYSGNASDSLDYQNNQQFSTKDRDNDEDSGSHCAQSYHGAWWYNGCQHSNLNGEYLRTGQISSRGVGWFHWKNNWYSMKRTEMKIKPN